MPRIFVEFESLDEAKYYIEAAASVKSHKEDDAAREKLQAERERPAAPETEEVVEPEHVTTFDDVKNAINSLSGKKGIEEVKKIFSEFNVRVAKDLSEEEYGPFVIACNESENE